MHGEQATVLIIITEIPAYFPRAQQKHMWRSYKVRVFSAHIGSVVFVRCPSRGTIFLNMTTEVLPLSRLECI